MCVAGLVDIKYINVEKRIEKHIQFFYNRKPYVGIYWFKVHIYVYIAIIIHAINPSNLAGVGIYRKIKKPIYVNMRYFCRCMLW